MNGERVIETAEHMVRLYAESAYTAHQRAIDHAISYDIDQWQHRYWSAVADAIRKQTATDKESK